MGTSDKKKEYSDNAKDITSKPEAKKTKTEKPPQPKPKGASFS
jgi:hypothetical protein